MSNSTKTVLVKIAQHDELHINAIPAVVITPTEITFEDLQQRSLSTPIFRQIPPPVIYDWLSFLSVLQITLQRSRWSAI